MLTAKQNTLTKAPKGTAELRRNRELRARHTTPARARLTPVRPRAVRPRAAMMSMQLEAEQAKAAPVAAHSVKEAKLGAQRAPSRGFAAQQ